MTTDVKQDEVELSIKLPGEKARPATKVEVISLLSRLTDPNTYQIQHLESEDGMDWDLVRTTANDNDLYHTMLLSNSKHHGMAVLRRLFPKGVADENNVVLFSIDTIHTGCMTIEQYEEESDPDEKANGITFTYIQPRLAHLRMGACYPETIEDFNFLKKLRQSSWDVLNATGRSKERFDADWIARGIMYKYIDHQVLMSGNLLDEKQWYAVRMALRSQYHRLREDIESNKPIHWADIDIFLSTCEALKMLDPESWEQSMKEDDGFVIFVKGKAMLGFVRESIIDDAIERKK